jgi:hypothetical protein
VHLAPRSGLRSALRWIAVGAYVVADVSALEDRVAAMLELLVDPHPVQCAARCVQGTSPSQVAIAVPAPRAGATSRRPVQSAARYSWPDVIARVDPDEDKVYVDRTSDQIKATAESHPGAGLNRDDRTQRGG